MQFLLPFPVGKPNLAESKNMVILTFKIKVMGTKPVLCSLLLLSTFIPLTGSAQVKKATYKIDVESKVQTIPDSEMQVIWGSLVDIYQSGKNYRLIATGHVVEWQLYLDREATLYSHMTFREAVFRHDTGTSTDSVIHINKGISEELVTGNFFIKHSLQTCNSIITLWLPKDVSTADCNGMKISRYTELMALLPSINCFPQRFTVEDDEVRVTGNLEAITEVKAGNDLFELPADLPVVLAAF